MKKLLNSILVNSILIGLIASMLLTLPVRAASEISIEIQIKPSFEEGKQMHFDYTFVSNENQEIVYLPHIDCPNAPIALLDEEIVDLEKGVAFSGSYYGASIDESIEPQTCAAYVQILAPVQQKAEQEFKIATNPSFDFYAFGCRDVECQEKTMVYRVGESFYLDYIANVEAPKISARLINSDGREMEVKLGKPVVLAKEGIYTLEISASKEGYKTMRDVVEIGVVEEFIEPIDLRICNANGICEPETGENHKNCPADCVSAEVVKAEKEAIKKDRTARKPIYYMLGSLGILTALGTVIYVYYRRRFYY